MLLREGAIGAVSTGFAELTTSATFSTRACTTVPRTSLAVSTTLALMSSTEMGDRVFASSSAAAERLVKERRRERGLAAGALNPWKDPRLERLFVGSSSCVDDFLGARKR
jgi:hypothetical protein